MKSEKQKKKDARRFVMQIIGEKINDYPTVSTNVLMMSEWLYDQGLSRGELISLRTMLCSKPIASDCDISELLARIEDDLRIDNSVVADKPKQWQLWEKKTYSSHDGKKEFIYQTDYAFVTPDGVVNEHRPSNPYGYLPFRQIYETENGFHQWDLRGLSVDFLRSVGWKKSSRKCTQESLEKGWLI